MYVNLTVAGVTSKITASGRTAAIPGLLIRFDAEQIVFRYGKGEQIAPLVFDTTTCPPYSVDICQDDGTVIRHQDEPQHFYFHQWRHHLVAVTVKNSPKQIFDAGLTLPFGVIGGKMPQIDPAQYVYKGPMDWAGITKLESTTGERNDIGLFAEWSSHFMLTGDAGPMLACAEGGQSQNIFLTDNATGRPIDKVARPLANTYYRHEGGDPLNDFNDDLEPAPSNQQRGFDNAHQPECFAMAYFATERDCFAEDTQYQSIAQFMGSIFYDGISNYQWPVPYWGQDRDFAWMWRSLILARKVTEMVEAKHAAAGTPFPAYLLPSTVFKQLMADMLIFLGMWQNHPAMQVFHAATNAGAPDWGFQDYVNQGMNEAALLYPQEMKSFYLWIIGNAVKRCDGKSGWPPANPTAYRAKLGPNMVDGNPPTPPFTGITAADYYQTWAACAAANLQESIAAGPGNYANNLSYAQAQALIADPLNGGNFAVWDYYAAMEICAVIAGAVFLDRAKIIDVSSTWPDLEACHTTLQGMLAKWIAADPKNVVPARVSIAVDAQPPSVVQPPPSQPPTGEPPMADDVLKPLTDAVAAVFAAADAEITAIHARLSAIAAAATGGTVIDPAELQAQVDALSNLKAKLAADTAALPTAVS